MKVSNEDLVSLGFPKIVAKNTYFWGGRMNYDFEKKIVEEFYNALFCLVKVYEQVIGKKVEVKKEGQNVFLSNLRVFHFSQSRRHTYKKQQLSEIKKLVKEIVKEIGMDELEKRMKQLYEYYDKLRKFNYGEKVRKEIVVRIRKELYKKYGKDMRVKVVEIRNGEFGSVPESLGEKTVTLSRFFDLRGNWFISMKKGKLIKCNLFEEKFLVLKDSFVVQDFFRLFVLQKL